MFDPVIAPLVPSQVQEVLEESESFLQEHLLLEIVSEEHYSRI